LPVTYLRWGKLVEQSSIRRSEKVLDGDREVVNPLLNIIPLLFELVE